MSQSGKFIVIEGTDGSGKGTQTDILCKKLELAGYRIVKFDFPRYDEGSTYFVKKYLNGDYGSLDEVGPYTGSLFFSLDRYEAARAIRKALTEHKIVIANRFTGSNSAHQGAKIPSGPARTAYFKWLDNFEFGLLGIPRPDLNIVLKVPADVAQKLVDKKAARSYTKMKRDIHEQDLNYLKNSVAAYDELCRIFPGNFYKINCVVNGELLAIDKVSQLIWNKVEQTISGRPKQPTRGKIIFVDGVDQGQNLFVADQFARQMSTGRIAGQVRKIDLSEKLAEILSESRVGLPGVLETFNLLSSEYLAATEQVEQGTDLIVTAGPLAGFVGAFYGKKLSADYKLLGQLYSSLKNSLEPYLSVVVDCEADESQDTDISYSDPIGLRAGYLWEAKQRGYPVLFAGQRQTLEQIKHLLAAANKRTHKETSKENASDSQKPNQSTEANQGTTQSRFNNNAVIWPRFSGPSGIKSQPTFFIPAKLSREIAKQYRDGLGQLIKMRSNLLAKISSDSEKSDIAKRTLPLACLLAQDDATAISKSLGLTTNSVQSLVAGRLGDSYQTFDDRTKLIEFRPKSEAQLIADILYKYTDVTEQNLLQVVSSLARDERLQLIKTITLDDLNVDYKFELTADLVTLAEIYNHGITPELQLISPRLGYCVPDGLKNESLTGEFESIFDLGLKLYSQIQAGVGNPAAQLMVLGGAKQRAKVGLSPAKLIELLGSSNQTLLSLAQEFRQLAVEAHPILAEKLEHSLRRTW